ncbi:MAG: acetyl-CoA carboxylase biotin carboxyl carrier protein [Ignavibacteriae bacterium HGW-Ignavibacteriae-2]|jgi:acetyl-CoA carboxylase biotin carboxyl carrier protein|nr:acetyl-CoA carboxylase biotin carboxyl carrier protein [Bacteroidota bacterium]PKL89640.1 MAG: acetyl-CoA carboxylase biotin carboxyl carrier protein [Ignavibacteriae bacterium HGW-Ignavibacteriae-2]
MDINEIKQLIKVVEKSEIAEFSIQEGDLKIRISKNSKTQIVSAYPSFPQNQFSQTGSQQNSAQAEPAKVETKIEPVKSENYYEIKSPIVGTFYRAPAPDADSYVQVGDNISEGSVLCIVEAMKLMNEIESDVNGRIVKILVENGTPVEFNQPLFLVEKS